MRVVIVVAVALACACAVEVTRPGGYHAEVGIPLAAKIKDVEEKVMAERFASSDGRIIGGVIAPTNAHPYFAGLLIDLIGHVGQSVCGSSLLTSNRLVTAAHCWADGVNRASRFTVILGTEFLYWGGLRIMTSNVFMHPEWTPANLRNDVAMIYLPSNVQFTTAIQPIALPTPIDLRNDFVGAWATAVGFGKTRDSQQGASTVLSHVTLQVISVPACMAVFTDQFVFPSTLCTNGAGRVGVCDGDSGGPLFIQRNGRPMLVGVSSFAAQNMCEQGFPSGFARVTSFLDFIQRHM